MVLVFVSFSYYLDTHIIIKVFYFIFIIIILLELIDHNFNHDRKCITLILSAT